MVHGAITQHVPSHRCFNYTIADLRALPEMQNHRKPCNCPMTPSCLLRLFMAFSILHDVLWEGKVACNCLELGYWGWPNFECVWKGCVWGSSGGLGLVY